MLLHIMYYVIFQWLFQPGKGDWCQNMVGDFVARKSYGKDVVFVISDIEEGMKEAKDTKGLTAD